MDAVEDLPNSRKEMTKVTRLTLDEEGGLDRRRIHLREISGDLETPLDAVGQDLRAARLRRGDDLATVSRALKIRKDHLEALEEDRIEALPGRTYAIGFIRSYADYLGLDAVQCVERFKAEIAGRTDDHMPTITVIDEDDNRRMPQGWKIIAGVVLVLVIYGAYQLAAQADRMLNEPVTPAPQTATHPVPHHPPPPAQVQMPLTQQAQAPSTAAPGIAGSQQAVASPSAAPGPQAAGDSPPLPQGRVYGAGNKNARVVLRMRDTARILVQSRDGKVLMNQTLKPGDTFQLPNQVGLTLTTPNAAAVEIDLDGQSLGVVGRNQETMEALPLDPQTIMDRYNAHRGG